MSICLNDLYNYANDDTIVDYLIMFENLEQTKDMNIYTESENLDFEIIDCKGQDIINLNYPKNTILKNILVTNEDYNIRDIVPYVLNVTPMQILVVVENNVKLKKNYQLSSEERLTEFKCCFYYLLLEKYRPSNIIQIVHSKGKGYYDVINCNKIIEGINWIKELRQNGKNWDINNPGNQLELYPNIKVINNNNLITKRKFELAVLNSEISLLPLCTFKRRQLFFDKGIFSFNDPNFNLKLANIDKEYVESVLLANQSNSFINKIALERFDRELFLDIENINDIIYLIGVGYVENSKFIFKDFLCRSLTVYSQQTMINQFNTFIDNFKPERIYIWGNHEKSMFNKCKFKISLDTTTLFDFCEWLQDEKIGIPGVFDFKLKNIGQCFKKLNLTLFEWKSLSSGLESIKIAKEAYQNNNKKQLQEIVEYNYYDVIIMYDIIKYFFP